MEPLRPAERAKLVERTNEAIVQDYETLLANRQWRVPGIPKTSEEEKADRRLAKLQELLFPKEEEVENSL